MADIQTLSDIDLAALLCSRVCHDVISPVGAIANGLEVLDDEDDPAMQEIAMDLIRKSARQASTKLQFCRIAFGAAGSAGAHLDLADAGEVSRAFFSDDKTSFEWNAPHETREKNQVKLLLNLALMASTSIPRGGQLSVSVDGDAFQVRCSGDAAKVPEKTITFMTDPANAGDMDSRLVQVYYTMRLAQAGGYSLVITQEGADIVMKADPAARAAA
ncbi:MAG: histidine phosphotransferase family protein [Pseudomonadota bacterium]